MASQIFHEQQQTFQMNQNELTPSQVVLFSRLNNHLLFHYTELLQFWTTSRLCVTLDQFQKMLQRIGFNKGKQEIQQMRQQNVQFVGLDRIFMGVKQWKQRQVDIITFMKKQQQYTKQEKKNGNQNKDKNHISDNNSVRKSRAVSSTTKSVSGHYLQQAQKKQQQALNNLNSTLIRTKHQSHYQLAIKIGELNDICKRLKNNFTYVIVTRETGDIEIVQKCNKTDNSRTISQKFFQKKYEEFKLQNNNLIDGIEGTLEKDLRETLVQVMYLSDQLEKQIALLKRKGINTSIG